MRAARVYSPRNVALDYLSRREHSRWELKHKLISKGFDEAEVECVLTQLEKENLQNDNRFAQSYIHYRVSKGVGPIKIRHELKGKGLQSDIIIQAEVDEDCDWMEQLQRVASRKYGEKTCVTIKEKQKRIRFLQQRGFVMQDIMRLFAS